MISNNQHLFTALLVFNTISTTVYSAPEPKKAEVLIPDQRTYKIARQSAIKLFSPKPPVCNFKKWFALGAAFGATVTYALVTYSDPIKKNKPE